MPVTAKLSKAFYDRLGEQIANELVEWFNQVDATYRSDLREINELNYARFEAKIEQRIAQLDAKIDRLVAEVRGELRAELRAELGSALCGMNDTLHRELREQTRFMVGVITALWAALLIPIVGLWMR